MAEEEPKVAPMIRLPQLRAAGGAQPDRASEAEWEPGKEAPEEREAEDVLEDEEEFNLPLRTQVSGDQTRFPGDTSVMRSGVSGLLRRALLNFAEQERQRATLVTILLAAQAAVLLTILPGYLFGQFQLAGMLVVLGGLAFFGIVWLLNWMGRIGEASYLLVIGSGALVVLDVLLSAAHMISLETLHISLLFILVILASGILFSPETALIFSIISAVFTALALLAFHPSAPLETVFTAQGRYLSLVYLVVVQPAVGVVAWLFGRQMQESVHLITYVAGLQMSNKGLRKRLRETAEKKRHLEAGIAVIQQTHARVAAGDYAARAHVEGDLLPLAVSLNLMLERVESFVHGEQERERMETAVAGLAELAGRVGQESLGQIPVPTGTALDGLSIAIKQMQANVNQRLARVQQSAVLLIATVDRCQDGLLPVAEVLEEHLRSIDALVLAADNVLNSAQRQVEFATKAEELLLSAAPVGVQLKVEEGRSGSSAGTSALRVAEEMERRISAAASMAAPALSEETTEQPEQIAPEPEQVSPEPEGAIAGSPATVPETQPPAASLEAPLAEASSAEQPAAPEPGEQESIATEPSTAEAGLDVAESAAPAGALQAFEPEALPEKLADDAASNATPMPAAIEPVKFTLADVDREAAEEEAGREPAWNLANLRALTDVLASMAGEATQQERNARTLTYKLRAMLQGMPNTRRVDMMATWLRTALEAIAQSANQVHQASKTIPASAFQPTRKDSNEKPTRD